MSTEENKEVARRFFDELWNKQNLDIVDELRNTTEEDREGQKAFARYVFSVWGDIKMTFLETIAEGDWVALRWQFEGVHKGEHLGVAPTGKHVEVRGVSMFNIVDGKQVGGYGYWDDLWVLEQLGVTSHPRPY